MANTNSRSWPLIAAVWKGGQMKYTMVVMLLVVGVVVGACNTTIEAEPLAQVVVAAPTWTDNDAKAELRSYIKTIVPEDDYAGASGYILRAYVLLGAFEWAARYLEDGWWEVSVVPDDEHKTDLLAGGHLTIWRIHERTGDVRRVDGAAETLYACLRGVGAC